FCATEPSFVTILVRDSAGAIVRTLWDGFFVDWTLCAEGYALVNWNLEDDAGARVPDGVYLIEVRASTDAGATDVESTERGVASDWRLATVTVPDPIRGAFEAAVQLRPPWIPVADVTRIEFWCYPDGGRTSIGHV